MIYPTFLGGRRVPIEVQANTPTVSRLGQETPNWSTVATLRGVLRPARGSERAVAGQITATLEHVVEARWPGSLVAVTTSHRLKIGARYFNVVWVNNVEERNRFLFLGCTERIEP